MWGTSGIHFRPFLLFTIYINAICHIPELLNDIPFADDTGVFYLNSKLATLQNTINSALKEVCDWFKCYELSLKATKRNFIFIGSLHQ